MYATIYHPRFEPDISWLRAMLLFYDTVHSIVPDSAGYRASPGIARLQDKAPETFIPLSPDIEDRAVFSVEEGVWSRYFALRAFLDELGNEDVGAQRISAPFYVEGGVVHLTLDRAVAVNYDKLGQQFIYDLMARKLAIEVEKPINPVVRRTSPMSRWLYIDNRIAALSLSVLAERMRERRCQIKHTSSDEALCFGVAAKSQIDNEADPARVMRARWNQEARLAAAVVRTQIPDDIGKLPLDEYLEIRKRYGEHRDIFHLAVAEIERLHLDRSFATEHELDAAIQNQLSAFATGIEKIKERAKAKRFRKWSTITLQRLVPVVGAAVGLFGVPPVAAAGAGAAVSYGLDFFKERAGQGGPGTYMLQAQALFASLTRDLSGEGWMARVFV